jgi:hypothetical protein
MKTKDFGFGFDLQKVSHPEKLRGFVAKVLKTKKEAAND